MPQLTIFLKTYRRPLMLRDAIESILFQDFQDWKLVIHDDCSGDETPQVVASYNEPRITYICADQNIASKHGDTEIVRSLQESCDTPFNIHLNDDDFYHMPDVFSREIKIFEQYPSLAFVWGGVAQKYPHRIPLWGQAMPWLRPPLYIGDKEDIVFTGGVYPNGFMTGLQYLKLFAEDYPNRNIMHGALMFRSELFRQHNFFATSADFPWQGGPSSTCGLATLGDMYFIDEPTLINRVHIGAASFRGTQLDYYRQCLASVCAGYAHALDDPELKRLRDKTCLGITTTYLGNKAANRNGAFRDNPLGDLSALMIPEISSDDFFDALAKYNIPLTQDQRFAIEMSDLKQCG